MPSAPQLQPSSLGRREFLGLSILAPAVARHFTDAPERQLLLLCLLSPWPRAKLLASPAGASLRELGTTLQRVVPFPKSPLSFSEELLHAAAPNKPCDLLVQGTAGQKHPAFLISDGPPDPIAALRPALPPTLASLNLSALRVLEELAQGKAQLPGLPGVLDGLLPKPLPAASDQGLPPKLRSALIRFLSKQLREGCDRSQIAAAVPLCCELLAQEGNGRFFPGFVGASVADANSSLIAAAQIGRRIIADPELAQTRSLVVIVRVAADKKNPSGAILFAIGSGWKPGRKSRSTVTLRDVSVSLARRLRLKYKDKRGGQLIRALSH